MAYGYRDAMRTAIKGGQQTRAPGERYADPFGKRPKKRRDIPTGQVRRRDRPGTTHRGGVNLSYTPNESFRRMPEPEPVGWQRQYEGPAWPSVPPWWPPEWGQWGDWAPGWRWGGGQQPPWTGGW